MDAIRTVLMVPVAIAWGLGGPITYIILVVDTWQSDRGIFLKLLGNLTFDAFLAMIWPITWVLWFAWELMGWSTPLSRVLGVF